MLPSRCKSANTPLKGYLKFIWNQNLVMEAEYLPVCHLVEMAWRGN